MLWAQIAVRRDSIDPVIPERRKAELIAELKGVLSNGRLPMRSMRSFAGNSDSLNP